MLRRLMWMLSAIGIAVSLSACALMTAQALRLEPDQPPDKVIYDDAMALSFQNWSFDAAVDFAATTAYSGSERAIGVTFQPGNWGALWLVRPGGDLDLTGYTALRFAAHGGSVGGQSIFVRAGAGAVFPAQSEVDLADFLAGEPTADEWRIATIPLAELGVAGGSLGSIALQSAVSSGQPTFFIDDLRLVGGAMPIQEPLNAAIHIDATGPAQPIPPEMLGSNLPAWLGRNRFRDATLRARTAASGLTVLRMPGGSWSNSYAWLSCEQDRDIDGALPCPWKGWVARPTDFIDFLQATNTTGMWVVNPNGTALEAAAVVAFFNGAVDDDRVLGVDIRGTNWYTVGHWAQLRAAHGNPEPVGIKLWEFGNEVYGGKPATGGAQCLAWGWEDVWTCDGTEYVNGKGSDAARHEGYLEFRAAMRAVDPTILVGAVGYEEPGTPAVPDWTNFNNWGIEVMAAAGDALDFYSIHPYAYFEPPPNNAAGHATILAQPSTHWASIRRALDDAFDAHAGGRRAPVAATEFNLISVQDQDNAQLMTRAVNALFLADSIGQAIKHGYAMLNQWDLVNGRASNGAEYALLHEDNGFFRAPQYYVYPLWARFGAEMLPVTGTLDAATQLSVYAGRVNTTTLSLLAINKSAAPVTATITAESGALNGGAAYVVQAASLTAQSVSYNGSSDPSDALTEPPTSVLANGDAVTHEFAPWSITLLHLALDQRVAPPPVFRLHLPAVQRGAP
ncbi:MAG: hypothetical protein BroJett021_50520 [Chloroflexota bacterium]|nr:hypothetical protein [Caldilinea sp.]GIK76064.1 MAG: hypothetical protein BroJett021_50520 [Chloroflexota bacterium]